MEWLYIPLQWYGMLFVLGIIMFPIVSRIFNRFPDRGYSFSKIFSILILSYFTFVLGIFKIAPFTQFTLFLGIFIISYINFVVLLRRKKETGRMPLIIFEEVLFFVAFIFWVYVRGQEPSLRSLEKFMDFGFINSILRAHYFPPIDMWLSGSNPINYYYFGHLTGAVLIKLTNIKSSIGYNLILATIFGLGITEVFSFVIGIIKKTTLKLSLIKTIVLGLIGSIIVNFGGNLHTIYLFTKGYPNDHPVPFWQIFSGFDPSKYWYPNATRFIPYTIHEFPSYSYIVADLHGHVFDIPFVLLTIAILFIMFIQNHKDNHAHKQIFNLKFSILNQFLNSIQISNFKFQIPAIIFLGFMTAVHYMTNAFDGPIYMLLSIIVLFVLYKFSKKWLLYTVLLICSFIVFSYPFSRHFNPFVGGIGVNCSPQFLTNIGKIGPFLFEKGNCQISPLWMLFILWGFFWINYAIFVLIQYMKQKNINERLRQCNNFIFILFSFGTFLTLIPEFFYIKDIYPLHFRANTMFKLGYQAFIMMGIASIYTFFSIKTLKKTLFSMICTGIFIFFFAFVAVYYFFAVPSYYGRLNQPVQLDGAAWLTSSFPEDKEIIDYLNTNEKSQPVILEAQGDSYTDFERISANTGLPTVAGWWVHEWLWRGSPNVISDRIPDVESLYESTDIRKTENLIHKYKIKYVIVSGMERKKYKELQENKFQTIGQLLLRSSNGIGALYKVN